MSPAPTSSELVQSSDTFEAFTDLIGWIVPEADLDSSRKPVVIVARSLSHGGASRATSRLVEALRTEATSFLGIKTLTRGQTDLDSGVRGIRTSRRWHLVLVSWAVKGLRIPLRLVSGFGYRAPSDYGLISSGAGKRLAMTSPGLIHLHWIGDGDLSLREIGQLPGPVVWTMHDMWTFLGAERFTLTDSYGDGYRTNHGEPRGRQFVNRFFFLLKKRMWQEPITLVAPSSWLAERAKLSPITRDWPLHVIPNALDTDFWSPGSGQQSRVTLGLPQDKCVILFGAVDPLGDHNKGADLLEDALVHLKQGLSAEDAGNIHVAVFGSAKGKIAAAGFPVSFLGQLGAEQMRDAYRSANVVVVPSRLENLPQVATEAASCGVPVVAFNTCGLPDVVVHKKTGVLVEPFDAEEMAMAIAELFRDSTLATFMGTAGRKRAVELWSYPIVAKQYLALYSSLLHT